MSLFSAGAKAGLKEGDTLVQINGWKIEAMDHQEVAVNVFLAAGYQVTVGWINLSQEEEYNDQDWDQLDLL